MFRYTPNKWQQQLWRKGDRYYQCRLEQDLFGNWLLIREWGGLISGKRGAQEHLCESYEAGLSLFEKVSKRRCWRRYVLKDEQPCLLAISKPHLD